jgi:predicted MPP superfamily phosphohydrolase
MRLRSLVVLLALLHAYIGVRLASALPPGAWPFVAAIVLACFGLLPKGWHVRDRGGWRAMAPWIAMGFFSWLLVLTLARDVALAFAAASWAGPTAWAVLGLTPLITFAGYLMARRTAAVKRVSVPVRDLPAALHGFTIAQISDIHVGPTIKRPFVEKIVARVNRLDADMVAITGDLVDGSVGELAWHTQPLADLTSRHGTYVVTGNHEYYSGVHHWIRELRRLGTRVLLNEHVVLQHDGAAITVAGVTDYSAHHFDPEHRSDPHRALSGAPEGVKVLLAHQPRSAAHAEQAGFHVQLSGHTHGGQFWPWNLFVRLQQPFTAGLNRLGRMWVYINRGTGYWGPPMRFGIPSEITLIRLVPE